MERGRRKEKGRRKDAWTPFRAPHEIEGICKRAFVGGEGEEEGKRRGNGSRPAEASTFKGASVARWVRRAKRRARAKTFRQQAQAHTTHTQSLNLGATFLAGMRSFGIAPLDATLCRMFRGRPPPQPIDPALFGCLGWPVQGSAKQREKYNWHRAPLTKKTPVPIREGTREK